jgi:hypothetical protein
MGVKMGRKSSLYAKALIAALAATTALTTLTAPAAHAFELPLTVAADQLSGYERSLFKHWIDADKDRCDTRKEVLIQEAISIPKLSSGCSFSGGKWFSAYDGVSTNDYSSLDIDHMIPLAEAWRSGAWKWSAAQREAFANDLSDPRTLIAVTASLNRQKGDQDPSTWLPPENKCAYVSNWIAIKVRYSLTVDSSEANALTSLVTQCNITSINASSLSAYASTAGIKPITLTAPSTAPTATAEPTLVPETYKIVKYSTCAKARAAGVTPIMRWKDQTLYNLNRALDRDKDGVACE